MLKKYETRDRAPSPTNSKTDYPGLLMQINVGLITSHPSDHSIEGPEVEYSELVEFLPTVAKQTVKDVHKAQT